MLEVMDLDFNYNGAQILKQINLVANKGEFIGIIGPNGSGKTTLLRTITNILKPRAGTIWINENHINGMRSKDIAKNVGMVSQGVSINFEFTVEDIVLMGRTPYIHGSEKIEDIDIVQDAMKKTNTYHLRKRLITQLSGGELQRVIIARALAQAPKVLLLDEPTSHLDISNQIEILNLIKNAAGKGMVVIAVIHDLNLAAYYCDRIYLLHDGEIIATGNSQQVLTPSNIKRAFNIQAEVIDAKTTNSLYVMPVLGARA